MENLLIAAITSGLMTAVIALFGRYTDHRRLDKNDRLMEYRMDLETLKKEYKILEAERNELFKQNAILTAKNLELEGEIRLLKLDPKKI